MRRWMRSGTRSRGAPDTRCWIVDFQFASFIQHREFSIAASGAGAFASNSTSAIIATPNESSDQSAIGVFCSGGFAHGARDLDATPKERRLGRGIWRGGHGEHFRRANDERAGEVHDLAGWHFLRAHVWVVGFVRASGGRRGQHVPARANETASYSGYFSRRGNTSGFARFFSSEFANSGVSCFFSGARGATNSDAIKRAFR